MYGDFIFLWAAKFVVKIFNIFPNANKSIEHIFTNVFILFLFETYVNNYKNAKNRIEKKNVTRICRKKPSTYDVLKTSV